MRRDSKRSREDDLEVERNAPMLQIVEVVEESLLHRRHSSYVIDLGPSSQPRAQANALTIIRDL